MKKIHAFTMAEVLVTLGVIGIVAAMTLPGVIAAHRSKAMEVLFLKRYNQLSEVLLMIKKEEEQSIYGNMTGAKIAIYFTRYLKNTNLKNAKTYMKKSPPAYKTFSKNAVFLPTLMDDGRLFLDDSFLIYFNTDNNDTKNIQFVVDINGYEKPNIAGYDLFAFKLDKTDTLKPMDAIRAYCNMEEVSEISSSPRNGWTCSYYAMTEKDYFKNLNW